MTITFKNMAAFVAYASSMVALHAPDNDEDPFTALAVGLLDQFPPEGAAVPFPVTLRLSDNLTDAAGAVLDQVEDNGRYPSDITIGSTEMAP